MSNKHEIVTEAIHILVPNIDEIFSKLSKTTSKITKEKFISVISKTKYNLCRDLESNDTTISKLLKNLFPNRQTNTTGNKPCTYLLGLLEYKQCSHCEDVKPFEDFSKNRSKTFGLNTYCKVCQLKTTKVTQTARSSKYKSAKLQRIPKWVTESELLAIKEVYDNCPEGHHVDHIIPLQGVLVSGLHCKENLQYLTATENILKNNKYSIE